MKELTKFLRFLFVSNLLLFGCSVDGGLKEEKPIKQSSEVLMTREDSIVNLADKLNIDYDKDDDVHVILSRILEQKKRLIARLDSLDDRTEQMERMTYEFKRKEDIELKKKLLAEIAQIKGELETIKQLAREKEIKEKEKLIIPEKQVTIDTKTFEDLTPGNYVTRLDEKHIIRIFVTPERQVIVSKPIVDSTTVFRGTGNINPRMAKEIEQIKEQFKKNNN